MTRAAHGLATQPPPRTVEGPWLVGDVGGTNARFAIVDGRAGEIRDVRVLPCARRTDLVALIRSYYVDVGARQPALACIALAGPITGDRCRTTNSRLEFSVRKTQRELGLLRLEVINDFAAVALAAPGLADAYAVRIGAPDPVPGRPIAVIGPGTGLGVAALVPLQQGRPIVLPGEGGHMLLPALDDAEFQVIEAARAERVALTAEMVVSGPGLARLHRLLARVHGVEVQHRRPEDICAEGLHAEGICRESLEMFCRFLGAVSSSVALTTGALGGVYLAGGILPQMAAFLAHSGFRARFEAHPVMARYLAGIATMLMIEPYPGLRGAAEHLAAVVDVPTVASA